MKKHLCITNRFNVGADGWFMLVPKGEHPWISDDGKERLIQVVDEKSADAIVNRFKAKNSEELMIDADHLSHNQDEKTEAYGWIDDLQNRGGNVWAHSSWTDIGEPAVKSRRYRFISPVFPRDGIEKIGNGRVRVLAVSDAGLTNQPNLPLPPLLNREQQDAWLTNNLPDDPASSPTRDQVDIQNKRNKTMKQIAQKVGLSAEASEDGILYEIDKLQNRAKQAEDKVKPLTEENADLKNRLKTQEDQEVESILTDLGIKDETERETVGDMIRNSKNRPKTVEILKNRMKPAAVIRAPLTNRRDAKNPGDDNKAPLKNRSQLQREAIDKHLTGTRTNEQAYQAAKRSDPDLFKPETEEATA